MSVRATAPTVKSQKQNKRMNRPSLIKISDVIKIKEIWPLDWMCVHHSLFYFAGGSFPFAGQATRKAPVYSG
jgi:hypothetical protein